MPFVPVPNTALVELRATKAVQQIENTWHVEFAAAPSNSDLLTLANDVLGWAEETYFPLNTSTVLLREVVVTDLSSANGDQVVAIPAAPVAGGLGNNPMPNESSMCVSLRSGQRGRSARGRTYVLGIDKGVVSENIVTQTYADDLVDCFDTLISVVSTASRTLVVTSYEANKVPRPGGPVNFPLLVAVVVDLVVDSMRRRKPGVGS